MLIKNNHKSPNFNANFVLHGEHNLSNKQIQTLETLARGIGDKFDDIIISVADSENVIGGKNLLLQSIIGYQLKFKQIQSKNIFKDILNWVSEVKMKNDDEQNFIGFLK